MPTVAQLRQKCKDKEIKGFWKWNKDELIKKCGNGPYVIPKRKSVAKPSSKKKSTTKKKELTVAQLRQKCKEKGIKGFWKWNKDELIKKCGGNVKLASPPTKKSGKGTISCTTIPVGKLFYRGACVNGRVIENFEDVPDKDRLIAMGVKDSSMPEFWETIKTNKILYSEFLKLKSALKKGQEVYFAIKKEDTSPYLTERLGEYCGFGLRGTFKVAKPFTMMKLTQENVLMLYSMLKTDKEREVINRTLLTNGKLDRTSNFEWDFDMLRIICKYTDCQGYIAPELDGLHAEMAVCLNPWSHFKLEKLEIIKSRKYNWIPDKSILTIDEKL